MLYFVSDSHYSLHQTGEEHPEQPTRTLVVNSILEQEGVKNLSNTLQPRLAHQDELCLCHTIDYVKLVQKEIETLKLSNSLTILSTGDTVISSASYQIARLAAGGALVGIDTIMNNKDSQVFSIIRPPGHHACRSIGMGFCLFNNAAIAARYAQIKYGIERVLIVDWDVHHGNGTQDIFYEDPSVFYFSTHEAGLYPRTGLIQERGKNKGFGTTLNCPILPTSNARKEVIQAFEQTLLAQMTMFQPQLIIISAGFDAHEADPLGHFNLTEIDFYHLTLIVKEVANTYACNRILSVLEGGYHLQALSSSSLQHAKALAL